MPPGAAIFLWRARTSVATQDDDVLLAVTSVNENNALVYKPD
jgi:hypothetical protein